jgi:hypothetical protein
LATKSSGVAYYAVAPVDDVTRIRQRLFETLDLIADEARQRRYQASVPHIRVSEELFNQWEDWYGSSQDGFRRGFDPGELAALREFDLVLNEISEATPKQMPGLEEFIATPEWLRLSTAAKVALGRLKR